MVPVYGLREQMNIQRYPDDDPHHAATIVIKAGA
jgi:hypothetical protein